MCFVCSGSFVVLILSYLSPTQQVAKIPEQMPDPLVAGGLGEGGKGTLKVRLDAAAARLARLEADLAEQFSEIEMGMDELEANLAAEAAASPAAAASSADAAAEAPSDLGEAEARSEGDFGSPHVAAWTPYEPVTPGRLGIFSRRPPAERGTAQASPAIREPPTAVLSGQFAPLQRSADEDASAPWRRQATRSSNKGRAGLGANLNDAARQGVQAGLELGLREDPGRRLYLTGVQHHAHGPVLMTLDLHDLRAADAVGQGDSYNLAYV